MMGLFGSKKTVEFTVPDMNCGHCEAKVTAAVKTLDGVAGVTATSADKKLVIQYKGDAAPDFAAVNAVLEPAGYPLQA